MNISPITMSNGHQNNTSFKSQLIATPYIKKLLDESIKNPQGQRKIVEGIRRILLDGKNSVVKIDFPKNKLVNLLCPGAYKITIDDNSRTWNYHFVGGGIGLQGRFALEEVYQDEYGQIKLPENDDIIRNSKLAEFRKRINDCWKNIFDEYDYGTPSMKKIRTLKKSKKFLEQKYSESIKEELIKLRSQLFPTK